MMDDMSQYLGVFLDEATEQLELLERDILLLEQNPSQELLNGIFRAAHTLKGSSRAMGFTAMGELTHAMEDVFDQLRQNRLTVTRDLVDALFAGLDMLKAMTEEIAAQGATELDAGELTARLRQTLEPKAGDAPDLPPVPASAPISLAAEAMALEETTVPPFALTDAQKAAIREAQQTGLTLLTLRVRLASDCLMKSVRAMMVLQALEQVGSLLATRPEEEALDNEEFEDHFHVLIATEREDAAVIAAAQGVNEVADVQVHPFTLPSGDATAATMATPQPAATPRTETQNALPIVDERQIDAGPEARGKSPEEVQKIAAEKKQAQTVRVDVTRLDTLLNLVGELVMDRNRIAQLCGQMSLQVAANDILDSLQETAAHVGRITDELQEEIMKARMLPISNVFSRFPRMVRDLAQKLNKEVDFVIEGGETELDRS
ncbi:MAG: Hpt domain-containing protein, partial [Chloroherpetonaceae bacterium]|nr:Hpt domain-containing protein [Chthonomonadaceae bacterium]MDW8209335.1 Hpt domain-containing protein [Chloroherpetonaceae bacterium]